MKNFFKIYKFRKSVLIATFFISIINIALLIFFIINFFDYIKQEYIWTDNTVSLADQQRGLFLFLNIINIIAQLAIFNLALIALINFKKEKNNGYWFLRITTYIGIIIIIASIVILFLEPAQQSKETQTANGFTLKTFLPGAKYGVMWYIMFSSIFVTIFSGLARKEFGYITNDKHYKIKDNLSKI